MYKYAGAQGFFLRRRRACRVILNTFTITACRVYDVSGFCYTDVLMKGKLMNWMKWDYVCPQCDANIEMTLKSDGQDGHISLCPKCRGHMTLMSVVDATIGENK